MPTCRAKLSNGKPCPKSVEEGQTYCRWHDPEDESWRMVYERLESVLGNQKSDIVLGLIEDHPERRLVLPKRNGLRAELGNIDLSREKLRARKNQNEIEEPPWLLDYEGGAYLWEANLQGAVLGGAKLQSAHLEYANLQDAFLDFADLQDAHLSNANLEGAYLARANLQGANLLDANLEGAELDYINLQDAFLSGANLKSVDLEFANLEGASLHEAKLSGAKLQGANLQVANLYKADLQDANLVRANLHGAYLYEANLLGASLMQVELREADLSGANLHFANLQDAKLHSLDLSTVSDLSNIFISGAWLDKTRLRRDQLGGAIGEEVEGDFSKARRGYLALKQNFDDLGDYDAASWAYRKERRMEKLEAKEERRYFKFLSDTLVELLCDYGESVWRVIFWMAVLLLITGPLLFSALGGFVWPGDVLQHYSALPSPWHQFWYRYFHYLLFSLDALTTANFSGLQPATTAVKLASGFFAMAGIFLVGLLGFVAGNRIRRS